MTLMNHASMEKKPVFPTTVADGVDGTCTPNSGRFLEQRAGWSNAILCICDFGGKKLQTKVRNTRGYIGYYRRE
jgi:hypothetical protein